MTVIPQPRRFRRHRLRCKIDLQAHHSFTAWTHDLSEDGLCFELPTRLDQGRELVVWIYLSPSGDLDRTVPIQARCRVMWSNPSAKGNRHGGQFSLFANQDKHRLREYLRGKHETRPC